MMTDQEFDTFVAVANDELRHKNGLLTKEHGLANYANFYFDQSRCELAFMNASGHTAVKMGVLDIGSFLASSNTWCWAWGDSSIIASMRQKCEPLKGLYQVTGKDIFKTSIVKADEVMAWEFTAMAVKHLNSLGAYCMPVPGKQLKVFVSIENIYKAPSKRAQST